MRQLQVKIREKSESRFKNVLMWCLGVGFTLIVALSGLLLAKLPVFKLIGPLSSSILIACVYRQIFDYPVKMRSGIQFSSAKLLRAAIILYGLKLNINLILHQGLFLLVRDAFTIVLAIGMTLILARWLKADFGMSVLLGIGTGVCGAAAIAAVSPILKAKQEDTAISVGIIALVGTVFAIGYTLLRPLLPLSSHAYGIWSGISIHEIAQVALAAQPAGHDALTVALLAKLGRVFLLVPLSLILMFFKKDKSEKKASISFPWFILGFIGMSLVGSYVLGKYMVIPQNLMNDLQWLTQLLLTMAMVGLGLNINIKDLRSRALKPLIAMVLASLILSVVSFITVFI